MIPDEVVERVREAADAVAIIGEQVKLRRVGSSFRGPCPFHQGKNPNFAVNPRTGFYHCFKCNESGDVFTFVRKRMGLDFVEAVKFVGARSGIEVRDVPMRRDGPDPREPLWEVVAAAAEFVSRTLWDDPAGAGARDYLAARRVSRDVAERFGLGYAPREGEALRAHLATLGFDEKRQLEAGLLVRREDQEEEPRARFRGRLMFPIYDAQGRAVGFGGRVLGQGEPKYLNSPESPVFAKGRMLYGLNWAKNTIRRDDRVLVVEGYFDVLRCVAAGVEAVVAPLGTALTEDQAALITRYTRNVYLLYDSDEAGLRATFRAGDALLAKGASVQVVTLPEGEDPDTYVTKHGGPGLEAQLGSSVDVFDRKVQILERRGYFADLRRKRKALDRLLPTIRATADPITQDLYLGRAADAAGVSRELLVREVAGDELGRTPHTRAGVPPAPRQPPPRVAPRRERRRPFSAGEHMAERELLRALLHYRNHIESIAERLGETSFRDVRYRQIFGALVAQGSDATVETLAGALDAAALEELQALLADRGGLDDPGPLIDGCVARLQARPLRARLAEIDREFGLTEDVTEKDRLTREKDRLRLELQALGIAQWKSFRPSRPE
ncbi:MAG: DNA primase [Gemmatimonadaceae bacterium]